MSTAPLGTVRVADIRPQPSRERWLVQSLWAASAVGIIGGSPKSAKTWMGLDLAVSVASGTPCLGAFPVAATGPVLAYLAEDSLDMARERVEGICDHRGLRIKELELHLITEPTLRLDDNADTARLAATVSALRPRLLLLDPFVRIHTSDENHSGDVSRVLGQLRQLQRAYDVAVVLTHHTRKNGHPSSAGQALRGSGDLYAWGDSFAYLKRRQDGLLLTLEHRSEPAVAPVPLVLTTREDGSCPHLAIDSTQPGSADTAPPSEAELEKSVLTELSKGPLTRTALRAKLQVQNQRLGAVLAELVNNARLIRTSQGWSLP
jgi:hypothetical protein